MTELVIEEGITEIGINAFREMKNLKKVSLPDSVGRIHAYEFKGCNRLVCVESNRRYWKYVYDHRVSKTESTVVCGVETFLGVPWAKEKWGDFYICNDSVLACFSTGVALKVPEGIRSIKTFAFSDVETEEILLPSSLETVEDFAFSGLRVKGTFTYPESVKRTGRYAFYDSSVSGMAFPGRESGRKRKIGPQPETCLTLCDRC